MVVYLRCKLQTVMPQIQ